MDPSVYARMADLQDRHWWFAARRRILQAEIARLAPPAGAQILDAGCGPGANLAMLSAFGRVRGMELDAGARAHATGLGFEVSEGRMPGAPFPDEAFDLIAAFDVIEHIEDDAGAVADIARMLAPGGRVVASVPANPWMWSAHDAHHHHFRRYRGAGFRALFDASGLRVIRATHFNTLLFPLAAGARLARNAVLGRESGGSDDKMPPWPLNAALNAVFGAERPLLALTPLPFGVSYFVAAEKRR